MHFIFWVQCTSYIYLLFSNVFELLIKLRMIYYKYCFFQTKMRKIYNIQMNLADIYLAILNTF